MSPSARPVIGLTYLTRRVLALSPRPARILAEVPVDLPYPRHRGRARFASCASRCWRNLDYGRTSEPLGMRAVIRRSGRGEGNRKRHHGRDADQAPK